MKRGLQSDQEKLHNQSNLPYRYNTKDPSLPDESRQEDRSPHPIFIRPSECSHTAALAEELHSTFEGRKPRKREDYRKIIRKSETAAAALASTHLSLSGGGRQEAPEKGGPLRWNKDNKGEGPRTC
jgi:hypothetical protein